MSRQPQQNGYSLTVSLSPDPVPDLLHAAEMLDPHTALHTLIEAFTDVEAGAVLAVLRAWVDAKHPPHISCGLGIP
jgi:hypothetical protein